jgi:hypothetical protein
MRLACLYALLDCAPEIRKEHLLAALAVWRYCEASARYVFGDAVGGPVADELLFKLHAAGPNGLTRTELSYGLGRNRPTDEINRALGLLKYCRQADFRRDVTHGRPAERWFATKYFEPTPNVF